MRETSQHTDKASSWVGFAWIGSIGRLFPYPLGLQGTGRHLVWGDPGLLKGRLGKMEEWGG